MIFWENREVAHDATKGARARSFIAKNKKRNIALELYDAKL